MMLRDGDGTVKIHGAGSFHAVFVIQHDLGWHAANGGRNGRNRHRGQNPMTLSRVRTTTGLFLSGQAKL
jgi:hypothetical protein